MFCQRAAAEYYAERRDHGHAALYEPGASAGANGRSALGHLLLRRHLLSHALWRTALQRAIALRRRAAACAKRGGAVARSAPRSPARPVCHRDEDDGEEAG